MLTLLGRLVERRLVDREPDGRGHRYFAIGTEQELAARALESVLGTLDDPSEALLAFMDRLPSRTRGGVARRLLGKTAVTSLWLVAAFKAMQRAFPLLDPDGPVERREITVDTAFRGPGGRDAFEMVTRAVTEDRFVIDPTLERPHRGRTLERYVFESTMAAARSRS